MYCAVRLVSVSSGRVAARRAASVGGCRGLPIPCRGDSSAVRANLRVSGVPPGRFAGLQIDNTFERAICYKRLCKALFSIQKIEAVLGYRGARRAGHVGGGAVPFLRKFLFSIQNFLLTRLAGCQSKNGGSSTPLPPVSDDRRGPQSKAHAQRSRDRAAGAAAALGRAGLPFRFPFCKALFSGRFCLGPDLS